MSDRVQYCVWRERKGETRESCGSCENRMRTRERESERKKEGKKERKRSSEEKRKREEK